MPGWFIAGVPSDMCNQIIARWVATHCHPLDALSEAPIVKSNHLLGAPVGRKLHSSCRSVIALFLALTIKQSLSFSLCVLSF